MASAFQTDSYSFVPIYRLQEEVRELQATIAYLKDKLKRAEMALSRLHRTKNTLQHDIGMFYLLQVPIF